MAQEWCSGAYLITATADVINDGGVADPWGKVTNQRKLTGNEVCDS
jgi:hypothetical protein